MQKFSTFSERTVSHHYKPNSSRFIEEERTLDYGVLFFYCASESFPHFSKNDIRIIGGRSCKRSDSLTECFFDTVDLPESELPLFMQSLYRIRESTVLLPLQKKILAVFNPLLRSGGLGIAFIFNYSPCYAVPLIEPQSRKLLNDVYISPSFESLSKRSGKSTSAFANSFIGIVNTLNNGLSQSTVNVASAVNIMRSAANFIDLPITVELQLDDMSERNFDAPALYSFSTSLLCMARQLSADHSAVIRISGGRHRSISIDFKVCRSIDASKDLAAALFCEKMADELRVPFFIDIENGNFHAVFAPFREDPSLFGLKTGIFIDQKRFIQTL